MLQVESRCSRTGRRDSIILLSVPGSKSAEEESQRTDGTFGWQWEVPDYYERVLAVAVANGTQEFPLACRKFVFEDNNKL